MAVGKKHTSPWLARLKARPSMPYVALTFLVAAPWVLPGYIFSLDLVFTPTIPLPTTVDASYPFMWLLHVLSYIIPSQVIEKILLIGVLFLSGYAMHRLMRTFQAAAKDADVQSVWGCYFAGLLYMFNPFVYSRFMAGQLAILLGYALLPFFVEAFWNFCVKPERKPALRSALWATIIVIVSVHMAYPLVFVTLAIACLFAWRRRGDKSWRRSFAVNVGLIVVLTAALNSYWLVPALRGTGHMAQVIHSFTASDVRAFATGSRGWGVVGNVLGLQGFWADAKSVFLVPQDVFNWWRVPDILLWLVVLGGAIVGWRRARGFTVAFLLVAAIGFVLATGTGGAPFGSFNAFLAAHAPFFAGYRDPQKFVVLLVLAYCYFGSVAIGAMVGFLRRHRKLKEYANTAAFAVCLISVFAAPLMLWGFHGQLKTAEYPVEWNAVHDLLDGECTGSCKTLFLPWHLYMRYGFAGRIIADPAPKFFGRFIVASNDPEIHGAVSYASPTAADTTVATTILPAAQQGAKNIGQSLAKYDIRFVLLAKENDYKTYAYLDAQQDLKVVLDTPSLKLYKVNVGSHE